MLPLIEISITTCRRRKRNRSQCGNRKTGVGGSIIIDYQGL
jgi:hypothetical protein